ncbi:MAG: hypothetical protein LBO72_04150 [Helicobacteraceae bacterium]|jgi:hypothetical protein|nr:hypothetical protein [Helicobacteraceae bacterium]
MLNHFLDAATLFFIEIIEGSLQKGETLDEYANNINEMKRSRPLAYLALSSSFFFTAAYSFYYNLFNALIFAILLMKLADSYVKFYLFGKAAQNGDFSVSAYLGVPNPKITPAIRFAGAFLYPFLFYLAIS